MERKGRPLSLLNRLECFWDEHHVWLKSQYPGISFDRLKKELEYSSVGFRISPENFWGMNYGLWQQSKIDDFFTGLLQGRPLQYLSGIAYFYQSEFFVNDDVLIPRNESELLVEKSLHFLSQIKNTPQIADIGTGSGCLILSIARALRKPIQGMAIDISSQALEVAKINYHRLSYTIHPETVIEFLQTDRLNGVDKKFDLIISNPPYIKEIADRDLVHQQVKLHEPHLALFLPDDLYQRWFMRLFEQVLEHLTSGGYFIMEGHENHLIELGQWAEELGCLEVQVQQDYTERDRFLSFKKG
ncbi:MAG: hypothetical protein Fur0010_09250 [Bdellovibrio sp.]